MVAQKVKNLPAIQETQVQSLGHEDLLEKKGMATPPVFLPGEFYGHIHTNMYIYIYIHMFIYTYKKAEANVANLIN